MKEKTKEIWLKLSPYKNILLFMGVLFASNFIWKLAVGNDENSNQVFFFKTWEISGPFDFMVVHITQVVRGMLSLVGVDSHAHYSNDICFANHYHILVVWGCTAIKQAFIFLCILLITPGPAKHKIWYIPLGLFIVYAFNVLRIFIISLVAQNHPEYFHLLHEIILKYLYYGVIFLVWLYWEEKMNRSEKLTV